jgi:hypothetical protein
MTIELLRPPETPGVARAQLVDELKTLRKGRGIHASRIDERIGSALRRISGVAGDEGPVEIRSKVEAHLELLARSLPADLRTAALIAFAIAPDSRHPLYKDRVSLAATRIHRDPRTARRRIDEAVERLAELAIAPGHLLGGRAPSVSTGWHIAELVLTVALDRPRAELIEQCRITSEQDGLREVGILATTVLEQPEVDVFHGGSLDDWHTPNLALPHPLAYGETHEYIVRARAGGIRPMLPMIRYTPVRRCDEFRLHLRFPRGAAPSHLRRMGDDNRREQADQTGELHLRFEALVPGRTYGVHW